VFVLAERWFSEEMFRTDVGRSFVCTSQQTLLDGVPGRAGLVAVNFYDTRVEAFRVNATNTNFNAIGLYCLHLFVTVSAAARSTGNTGSLLEFY